MLHARTIAVIVLAPFSIPVEERNDTIAGAVEVIVAVTTGDTQGLEAM
jgi:hypothetical protein